VARKVGGRCVAVASNTCENQIPWHHLRKLQNEHTQRRQKGGAVRGLKSCPGGVKGAERMPEHQWVKRVNHFKH